MATTPTTIRSKRITELTSSATLLGDELFPILQEGSTKKASMLTVTDYMKKQDFSTWVYGNSATTMDSTSWVNSNSAQTINSTTWVNSNSSRETTATDYVELCGNAWSSVYNFVLNNIVTAGIADLYIGESSVTTTKIADRSITPVKLTLGGPSWDYSAGSFTVTAREVLLNPYNNTDLNLRLNPNNTSYKSNIVHRGTGSLNINSVNTGEIIVQTLQDGDIVFRTNDIERMRIDGTTGLIDMLYGLRISPTGKLIVGDIEANSLKVNENINMTQGSLSTIRIQDGANIDFTNSSNQTTYSMFATGNNSFAIFDKSTNQIRIFIDDDGNVGMGNTAPRSKLDVTGDVNTNTLTLNRQNTVAEGGQINFNKAIDNSVSYYADVYGNTSTPYFRIVDTNTGGGVERFILDPNGRVGIGTYPSYRLHVAGDAKINSNLTVGGGVSSVGNTLIQNGNISLSNNYGIKINDSTGSIKDILFLSNANVTYLQGNGIYFRTLNGSNLGYFDATGNFTAIGDVAGFSDERLKTNVKTIENALEKVNALRGVEFDRTDINTKGIGVIAQEVEKVLPDVVSENKDGYKSVAYGNMVGVLIEAVKELTKEVEYLKSKINN
jgi:hypothetical protein